MVPYLLLVYCRGSAFLQGRGSSTWGPPPPRVSSLPGLEAPPGAAEEEDTEVESTPVRSMRERERVDITLLNTDAFNHSPQSEAHKVKSYKADLHDLLRTIFQFNSIIYNKTVSRRFTEPRA